MARTYSATSGADSGSTKRKWINMSWTERSGGYREAEVRRLALALTAITLYCGSATRAQEGSAFYPVSAVCQPFPSWYPRGWELIVRYPCATYVYGSSYYPPASYPYPAAYPHQRVLVHAVHRGHRRPYLRPGWWW